VYQCITCFIISEYPHSCYNITLKDRISVGLPGNATEKQVCESLTDKSYINSTSEEVLGCQGCKCCQRVGAFTPIYSYALVTIVTMMTLFSCSLSYLLMNSLCFNQVVLQKVAYEIVDIDRWLICLQISSKLLQNCCHQVSWRINLWLLDVCLCLAP
jgi:hypothetical protein